MSWDERLKIISARKELSPTRSHRDPEPATEAGAEARTRTRTERTMLHPIMVGIIIINTSITVVYWAYILTQAFCVKPEDEDDP